MAYGIRFSLAIVIGVILAGLWLLLFGPSAPFFHVQFAFLDEGLGISLAHPETVSIWQSFIKLFNNSSLLFYSPALAFLGCYVRWVSSNRPFEEDKPTVGGCLFAGYELLTMGLCALTFLILAFLHLFATFKTLKEQQQVFDSYFIWFGLALLCGLGFFAGDDDNHIGWSLPKIGFGIGILGMFFYLDPFWSYVKGVYFPVLLLILPPGYVALKEEVKTHPRFRRWFAFSKGGSARWASNRHYRKYKWNPNEASVYLGQSLFEDTFKAKDVGIRDDAHLLTIGCTGSGKSVTALWPNLANYKGSIFVIDPKGEHTRMAFGQEKREDGKGNAQSFRLDPFDQAHGYPASRYNPLSDIDINSVRVRGMLAAISDACVVPEGPRNQHFVEMASLFLEGIIAHVLSEYPEENHNLPFVCDLLIGLNRELGVADPDRFNELLIDMRMNDVAGGIAQLAASKIDEMGPNERGSVLSTLTRSIKWITDPAMRKQLESSDFSMKVFLDDFIQTKIFLVLPFEQMKEQSRWARTITNVALGLIQNSPTPPSSPVLFILDEFPMLGGKLKKIEEGIVTLRSAGVKLWILIQNIGQLKRDYEQNWETFVSSSTVQLFGVKDLETAEWASEMLGTYRHQRKERSRFRKRIVQEDLREWATPEEIREELGKARPFQYVFPTEGLPMRLRRMAYKTLVIEGNRFNGAPFLDGYFKQ